MKKIRCLHLLVIAILALGCMTPLYASPNEDDGHINPCPIDADLWILAGHSNIGGVELATEPENEDPRLMMFSMMDEWKIAQEPIHWLFLTKAPVYHQHLMSAAQTPEEKTALEQRLNSLREASLAHPIGGVGPGLSFARAVLKETGRPIALIPCAQGGTTIDEWNPDLVDKGGNSHYGAMINRIRTIGGVGKIKGVLWFQQGASETYQESMLHLVDCLRRDTGVPDLPIISVQAARMITPDNQDAANWEKIREIQRQIPRLRQHVYMVSAADLPMTDHVHLSAEGQRHLGQRLAEVALTCVYQKPDHGQPIDLESIKYEDVKERGQGIIKLHFSGVSGRLKAAGEPKQFEILGAPSTPIPWVVYRVDLDPQDPAGLILHVPTPITSPVKLICGGGLNPVMNVTDERDMLIPCFGPLDVPMAGDAAK